MMKDPAGAEGSRRSLAARILDSLPAMTRFVRRRMGPELSARESASDIVQSTCRELLKSASSFEDRGEASFRRWMLNAAEHKLKNRARHWRALRRQDGARSIDDSRDGALEPAAPETARPSHDALLREEVERLQRAFAGLPVEYRTALVRSQIDGASHAEIASEMDRTPEAVRKLIARAMAKLSAELEPDEDANDG